jgi:hypothetical protein
MRLMVKQTWGRGVAPRRGGGRAAEGNLSEAWLALPLLP